MRFGALPFFTFLAPTLFTRSTHAIFADEAFHLDYQHSLLGTPQEQKTFFHRPSTDSKGSLLYTLSERNVLGAVNPKDGYLLWRHPLCDGCSKETTKSVLETRDGLDTLLTSIDGRIQAWSAADGRLIWEKQEPGKVKALKVVISDEGETTVFVLTEIGASGSNIYSLSGGSGDLNWKQSIR